MNMVAKSNGKFILRADAAAIARNRSAQDRESLNIPLKDEELRVLLTNILLRLEKLEQR